MSTAAFLTSPSWVLRSLEWLAADPVRFGLACLGLALVRPLVAWPATLVAVAVGYGYGVEGFPFALGLFVATSVPPYVVARYLGGDGPMATAGARLFATAGGTRGVAASRLLPTPSDVVSVGAGVSGVRVGPYLIGTAVGETPWAAVGVVAGSSLDSLTGGTAGGVVDLRLVVAGIVAAAALLAGPTYRYLSERGVVEGRT